MITRADLTETLLVAKHKKGLKWADIATAVGQSKEWTCAACMGQMTFSDAEAKACLEILGLPQDEETLYVLTKVPYRGSLPTAVPTDPLIYRFYELIMVYGTSFKELIEEEFGDGIMSAIDFHMDMKRVEDPKGDRVQIVLNGKFLSYKKY